MTTLVYARAPSAAPGPQGGGGGYVNGGYSQNGRNLGGFPFREAPQLLQSAYYYYYILIIQ